MNKDKTVNRVLRDLKMMGVVPEDCGPHIRPYLEAVWVAGYEHRGSEVLPLTHGNSKPIGQFDRTGQLINTYKSRAEAVKLTGYSDKGIRNSIYFEKITRGGWYWKFL